MSDLEALAYKGSPPDHCCCDSTLRILPNGEYCIFFMTGGPIEPHPDNYIGLDRSTDPGLTWTKKVEKICHRPTGACMLSDVIVDGNTITVFCHSHNGNFDGWENWTIQSTDNAKTWSDPKRFEAMPEHAFSEPVVVAAR